MILCDKNHEEICFEGSWKTECPLCKSIKEKDLEVEKLKAENERFEDKIIELENTITELEEK